MGSSTVTTRPGKPEGMVVERASGKRAEDGLTLDRVLGTPTKALRQVFLFLSSIEKWNLLPHFLSYQSINLSCDWADNQVVSGGFLFFVGFFSLFKLFFR